MCECAGEKLKESTRGIIMHDMMYRLVKVSVHVGIPTQLRTGTRTIVLKYTYR